MTTFTSRRLRIPTGVVLAALAVFASAQAAPEKTVATASKKTLVLQPWRPNVSASKEFYEAYVVPRMSLRNRDESAAAASNLSNPFSDRLAQDPAITERIGKQAIRAFTGGLKRLAIERLGIDGWSFPVLGGRGSDGVARAVDSRGPRLNLGFSSLAPRADLLIPVSAGRVVVSGDVRGRFATTFESASSKCRFAASVDVPEHRAVVGLSLMF